ncbi:MAG: glycosyltransferase [Chloroflexi bacterium]|nr:glycosyltransferase [Chloroflexota bacterium]
MKLSATGKFLHMKRRTLKLWILRVLVSLGSLTLLYYYSWWSVSGRITDPLLILALLAAILYSGLQIVGSWVLYLAARRPAPATAPLSSPTVDVFVAACGEPYALVRRALVAACTMRGNHRTWLLDDGHDAALAELAGLLGAGYLTRTDRKHAKAGNLNAALERTNGDIIVIFDVDHAPAPEFLEKTLAYFSDPQIGFVQVMPTFINGKESWVARAAGETSLDFYNPISLGMNRIGSTTLMGSNALIRRTALESIGGYQAGLAEDLATSVALHAAGWHSAYVAEPLAPGFAPPDLRAWFTQQLKWAHGVFEVMLTSFPRLFPRLTWYQRLSYGLRMTYYWSGPVAGIHLALALLVLMFGDSRAQASLEEYLISLMPLVFSFLLIRQMALRSWRHPSIVAVLLWRAIVLIYATWPIYTFAWIMAVLRMPLEFRPTPKSAHGKIHPIWLLPQFAAVISLTAVLLYAILVNHNTPLLLILFGLAQLVPQLILLWQWVHPNISVQVHENILALNDPSTPDFSNPIKQPSHVIGN